MPTLKRKRQLVALRDQIQARLQQVRTNLAVTPRSTVFPAQIVSKLYDRLTAPGVVYTRTAVQASDLVRILGGVGFAARLHDPRSLDSFNDGATNILVGISGEPIQVVRADFRFVLHVFLPSTLRLYLQDLPKSRTFAAVPESEILYSEQDHEDSPQVHAYCRKWVCRYAQIVHWSAPHLVEPLPYEFDCGHCDVCRAEPRACFGNDVTELPISVGPIDG